MKRKLKLNQKMKMWAGKGLSVAFKRKSNATKYKRMLSKNKIKYQTIRSNGPTVESRKTRSLSYYIHVGPKLPLNKYFMTNNIRRRRI